jgi:hypothetical protein
MVKSDYELILSCALAVVVRIQQMALLRGYCCQRLSTDGNQRYSWMKNRRSLFVKGDDPRGTCGARSETASDLPALSGFAW